MPWWHFQITHMLLLWYYVLQASYSVWLALYYMWQLCFPCGKGLLCIVGILCGKHFILCSWFCILFGIPFCMASVLFCVADVVLCGTGVVFCGAGVVLCLQALYFV